MDQNVISQNVLDYLEMIPMFVAEKENVLMFVIVIMEGNSNCSKPKCFGKSENHPFVCSGRGNCTWKDTCVCEKD